MSARVRPDGPLDARFAAIGEAPASEEVRLGRPFVGPAGALQAKFWHEAGLKRSQFRIYNTFEYACPKAKIALAPREEVDVWAATLPDRIAELTNPAVIVPMGNIALRALLQKPLWANTSPKVGDLRGSILQHTFPDGRTCKLVPTIHPAAVFRDPSVAKLIRADWKRIAVEAESPDLRRPERYPLVPPIKRSWIDDYHDESWAHGAVAAIDIETNPQAGTILCVGFSFYPDEALVLPWPKYRDEIRRLCESPCTKVGQNFLYDRYWLAKRGSIEVKGPIYDLLSMHHAIDSTLPHSLAEMASLYTREPFWKRSHKDMDSPDAIDKTPLERLYTYNATDAMVTRELFDVFYNLLDKEAA